MRKPKIHPEYKIDLVGIKFRERWNIVLHAKKEEIENYISNFMHIEKKNKEWSESENKDWWQKRLSVVNETVQNNHLRKLWRKRHSESFKEETIYRIDKNIKRWEIKLGPSSGHGLASSYHWQRKDCPSLSKNDMLVLTNVDEMGNLYFSKINEINAPHPYVFNRENVQLGFIIPLES